MCSSDLVEVEVVSQVEVSHRPLALKKTSYRDWRPTCQGRPEESCWKERRRDQGQEGPEESQFNGERGRGRANRWPTLLLSSFRERKKGKERDLDGYLHSLRPSVRQPLEMRQDGVKAEGLINGACVNKALETEAREKRIEISLDSQSSLASSFFH